jgi:hypothetical protein
MPNRLFTTLVLKTLDVNLYLDKNDVKGGYGCVVPIGLKNNFGFKSSSDGTES